MINAINFMIKSSKLMTEMEKLGNSEEDSYIRIPKHLIDAYNISLGTKFFCEDPYKREHNLVAQNAYIEDISNNKNNRYCFVSENTYNKLCLKRTTELLIGCDPELFLVDIKSNTLIKAIDFLEKEGPVGHDGVVAEIRPNPSIDPNTLTYNIHNLLQKLRFKINTEPILKNNIIKLTAADCYNNVFAGFHVHFGVPDDMIKFQANKSFIDLFNDMTYILDYYVGVVSILIDGVNSYRRLNPAQVYGKAGDYRVKSTFEYRVPSGNILKHPIYTKGILALSLVVMSDILSKVIQITDNFKHDYKSNSELLRLYPDLPTSKELYNSIYRSESKQLLSKLAGIYCGLTKIPSFFENKDNITVLFDTLSYDVKYSNDINNNWVSYFKQVEPNDKIILCKYNE